MSKEEIWAIGLFEGEGCIWVEPKAASARLLLKSTDYDVLERVQKLWGGTIRCAQKKHKHYKDIWVWRTQKREVVRPLLEKMLPFLSMRRACKAQDALDNIDKCYVKETTVK